jgi:hypothetical protein
MWKVFKSVFMDKALVGSDPYTKNARQNEAEKEFGTPRSVSLSFQVAATSLYGLASREESISLESTQADSMY